MSYDPARRARVADILERQNRAWDASPKTLENIARLRGGASALVTGQQVGPVRRSVVFHFQSAQHRETGWGSHRCGL